MTLLSLTENEQCLKENFLKQILPEWTKETKTYYKIKRAFFTTKTSINQAEKKKNGQLLLLVEKERRLWRRTQELWKITPRNRIQH